MPRRLPNLVRWLPDKHTYGVDGEATSVAATSRPVPGDSAWFDWLERVPSFAFRARSGAQCTVRKETLLRGGAYWYGYRSCQGHTRKRYIGRTADLSIARLEEVAERLAQPAPELEAGVSQRAPLLSGADPTAAQPTHRTETGAPPPTTTLTTPAGQAISAAVLAGHAAILQDASSAATPAGQTDDALPARQTIVALPHGQAASAARAALQGSPPATAFSSPIATLPAVETIPAAPSALTEPMTPLLASKLHPPRLSTALVARSRLLDRLDTGLAHKLTLLSAPAGFGKTTLVCQWLAARAAAAPFPVAWVSLDAGDDDPVRFWRYVITACRATYGDVGEATLAQLAAALPPPFEPPRLETALTFFLNDLTRCAGEGLLVLEDYHAVTTPRIHETLTFFLDQLPPRLHLVLLTRTEPPLPLVRWRAKGDLHELHAADLRFSLAETTDFLQRILPAALPEKALAQLDARLEGWPAGLRLLALTMQGPLTPREVDRLLVGLDDSQAPTQPHRSILDYFVSEVLQAQPAPLQHFLLQTSILSRLTGPLCNAVTGRGDGAALLEALERAGLFLESLDESGQWYRYHALFAEAMRATARQRLGDEVLHALSLQASQWYERHGLLAEAIDAALHAGAAEQAAVLIEQLARGGNVHFDELHTSRRWLEQLPEAVRSTHPALCLAYGMALLFTQYPDPPSPALMARVHAQLQLADDLWREQGDLAGRGEVWAFRAMLAWRDGYVAEAARDARQSLAWLPDEDATCPVSAGSPARADRSRAAPTLLDNSASRRSVWEWRAVNIAIMGTGALEEGRIEEARRLLQDAQRRSTTAGTRPFIRIATLLLGTVCAASGDLHQAEVYYRQVLPDARDQGDQEDIAFSQISMAELCYEWNDLDTVERLIRETHELGEPATFPEIAEYLAVRQALLQHARGRTTAALQQLAGILARLQAVATPRAIQAIPTVLVWQGRLQIAAGDLFAAQRSLDALGRVAGEVSPIQRVLGQVLAARLLLAGGQAQQALSQLEALLATAREQGQVRLALELGVLRALALAACRLGHEARQQLRQVLSQACGEGFMRLFLDEGEPLAALLRSLLPSLREPALYAYACAILQAFAAIAQQAPATAAAGTALIEPLSTQERRVLRLLAAGRSNPEIAQELVVSVNTVKGHVKSLYRKLDVRTRLEATEAARRLAP